MRVLIADDFPSRHVESLRSLGLEVQLVETTFFLSRESLVAGKKRGMARWRRVLFGALARNAQPATAFFNLPANRVVELGMQIEL